MKAPMLDGTGWRHYRHVVKDTDRRGNERIYLRRPGMPKVRLHETPGTPAFETEYQVAMRADASQAPPTGRRPAAPASLRWLVERYYRSAEFTMLAPSTRRVRRGILDALCERCGSKPYATMPVQKVRELRDEKAQTPFAADNRLKALRQLFSWAIEAGHATENPALHVRYINAPSEGFHTWTVDEVRQFEARHPAGSLARLALALLLFTGVRRSDVVCLGRQLVSDGCLRFTETKGRRRRPKHRVIPILPELQAIIDVTPSGNLTFITTEFGRPFTPEGFGNKFRNWCDEADLPHCSAHGLRKAGATIATDMGASEFMIQSILGHTSTKHVGVYTRQASTKRATADGLKLLSEGLSENKSVPLPKAIASGGTKGREKP